MTRAATLAAALWLVACGGVPSSEPAPGVVRQGIVGGTLDSADPAVVALSFQSFVFCSGTLIGPSSVLTAGHCVQSLGPGTYLALFGADAAAPTRRVTVSAQAAHPLYAGEGKPYDFGVFTLQVPVSEVTPVPLNTVPLTAAEKGQPLRHVGFGISDETSRAGRGLKREVTYPITALDGGVVFSGAPGEQTCDGDSGGPGLMARPGAVGERLTSVVSAGADCHSDGWDMQVTAGLDWIQAQVPAATGKQGGCGSTGGSLSGGWLAGVGCCVGLRRRRRRR